MMSLMLQQNSGEMGVKKMILLVIFFTITFLKGQQLRAHTFLESVSSCILYRVLWLSIRHLIVLDLAVAMLKIAKGIAPKPTLKMFHYVSELHPYDTRSASS